MIDLTTDPLTGWQTLDGQFLATEPTITVENVIDRYAEVRGHLDTNDEMTPEILAHVIPYSFRMALELRGVLDAQQIESRVAVESRLIRILLDGIAEGRSYS